jgi:3-dehydroquinate dehydratase-2
LNLLGTREPEIYGKNTLQEIQNKTDKLLKSAAITCSVEWYQSNSESEIVERLHALNNENIDILIINPGAFSHTSVAILDALKSLKLPKVEVHLSHTLKREEFRHKKITALGCDAVVEGLGPIGYFAAIISKIKSTDFIK